jgi:hypothetical protein
MIDANVSSIGLIRVGPKHTLMFATFIRFFGQLSATLNKKVTKMKVFVNNGKTFHGQLA